MKILMALILVSCSSPGFEPRASVDGGHIVDAAGEKDAATEPVEAATLPTYCESWGPNGWERNTWLEAQCIQGGGRCVQVVPDAVRTCQKD